MTLAQDALNAVTTLTVSNQYETVVPILKALDRLQELERHQDRLLNREVIARELFVGSVHGIVRDDLVRTWGNYLLIETQGFPKGNVDPRELLAKYRAQADVFVQQLQTALVYN